MLEEVFVWDAICVGFVFQLSFVSLIPRGIYSHFGAFGWVDAACREVGQDDSGAYVDQKDKSNGYFSGVWP